MSTCNNCGGTRSDEGCIGKYSCCSNDSDHPGCKFSCCNSRSRTGCEVRCTECGRLASEQCYAKCLRCKQGPGTTCTESWPHKYPCELKDRKHEDPKPGEKSVILLIGATGSGKSTLVNALFGKLVAKVSHGTASCTSQVEVYSLPSGHLVIDTQGTLDSSGRSDEEIWIEIFKHMQGKGCGTIGMVLWLCEAKSRSDAVLKQEAKRLLNLHPDIFRIVVPIQKAGDGGVTTSPQLDAIKALSVAKSAQDLLAQRATTWTLLEAIPDSNPRRAGYTQMDATNRKTFDVWTFAEAKTKLLAFLPQFKALKLVFVDETCQVCLAKGDRRLLKANCHKELSTKHSQTERSHPGYETHSGELKYKHPSFSSRTSTTTTSQPTPAPPKEEPLRSVHIRTRPMDGGGLFSRMMSGSRHSQVVIGKDEGSGDWYEIERDCDFSDRKSDLSWRKGNKGSMGGSWQDAEEWESHGYTRKTATQIREWCDEWIRRHRRYDSNSAHCGVFAKELCSWL